jgi:hypothetical protein
VSYRAFPALEDADDGSHGTLPERGRLTLALKLILLTFFLPEGLSIFIAGLRLTLTRLIFMAIAPMLVARFAAKMGSGRYRFVASDLFVPLTAFWMFVGPTVTDGLSDALAHSGPVVLEYLIAYLSTRVLLSRQVSAIAFIQMLCIVVSFIVMDALLDTITGRYFTREVVEQVTGFHKFWGVADEYRFGLLRAAGPIEHPILFGFISGLALVFAAAVKIKWRWFCIVMCTLGVVISFSSAPEQSSLMGLGLLAYSRLFAKFTRKWEVIWIPAVVVVVVLFESTATPFGHIFDLITIDPQTAYYRLYIWNAVGPAILQAPFFAVLSGSYDYEGSVDSVWLVLSLTYGMPCAILAALSMIGSCSLSTSSPQARLLPEEARLGTALGIAIFLVMFMGFTVHFWGSAWILVGLLLGVRAHLGELGRLDHAEPLERVAELAAPAGSDGWIHHNPSSLRPMVRQPG